MAPTDAGPTHSLTVIALDVVVIWALCTYR
jgi:hypothetical protein